MPQFTSPEALHKRGISIEQLAAYAEKITAFIGTQMKAKAPKDKGGNHGDPEKKTPQKKEK